MPLDKNYIPVISPVGLGRDGGSYNIKADHVAAEIAVAAGAKKLIFLTDVAGILDENGQLLSQLVTADRRGRLQEGKAVKGGMAVKSKAVLRALEGGFEAVHVSTGASPTAWSSSFSPERKGKMALERTMLSCSHFTSFSPAT
jgi:acetylglutamate kinase